MYIVSCCTMFVCINIIIIFKGCGRGCRWTGNIRLCPLCFIVSYFVAGVSLCVHLTVYLRGAECVHLPHIGHLRDFACELVTSESVTVNCHH